MDQPGRFPEVEEPTRSVGRPVAQVQHPRLSDQRLEAPCGEYIGKPGQNEPGIRVVAEGWSIELRGSRPPALDGREQARQDLEKGTFAFGAFAPGGH
jgi:hypothetical protein